MFQWAAAGKTAAAAMCSIHQGQRGATHWRAGGNARAAGENSYRVGLSTRQDLANLCSGLGSSMGDGRGEPEDENRRARADAVDDNGLRLMGFPGEVWEWTDSVGLDELGS